MYLYMLLEFCRNYLIWLIDSDVKRKNVIFPLAYAAMKITLLEPLGVNRDKIEHFAAAIREKGHEFISVAFTGVDHVDIEKCREKGILVTNASGYSDIAVATKEALERRADIVLENVLAWLEGNPKNKVA